MRLAVLADIHGNLAALEAVIADMADRTPDLVVNLGDSLSGPLAPSETADRLMALGWPTVRGNHDRYLSERQPADLGSWDRPAFDTLTDPARVWLRQLPASRTLEGGRIYLCHATPASDETYPLEGVAAGTVHLSPRDAIEARFAGVEARLILVGHSHISRMVVLADGRQIVNPGSVGIQAFSDSRPIAHVVESGNPHARYAIVESDGKGWRVDWRAVAYDWEAAAEQARLTGEAEWEYALRTGYARREGEG